MVILYQNVTIEMSWVGEKTKGKAELVPNAVVRLDSITNTLNHFRLMLQKNGLAPSLMKKTIWNESCSYLSLFDLKFVLIMFILFCT